MRLGNIYEDAPCKNDNFYFNVGLKEFEKCKTCLARNICAGGCISENYDANQDIRVAHDSHCKYYLGFVREVIRLYIRLDEEKKEKLFGK
jgi:uncharacterized protein